MNCPFCGNGLAGAAGSPASCPSCGRNPRVPRKPCPHCQGWTPSAEPACCRCGERFKSELRWKVPLIIGIFLLAFLVSAAIHLISSL